MTVESVAVDRTFSLTGPAHLRLRNVSGSIDIQRGEDGQLRIMAIKRPGRGYEHTTIDLRQDADGRVVAETRWDEHALGGLLRRQNGPCPVDYLVRVPQTCVLDIAGVSCPIRLSDAEGEARISSVSGDVHLHRLTGRLHVKSVSGSVLGQQVRCADALQLETVSGDVTLAEASLPAVNARTVSGTLRLETALGEGPYYFRSVSGDVYLSVPADTACSLSLRSMSGRLRATLPAAQTSHRGSQLEAQIGTGGPSVVLHTLSGDLNLVGPAEASAADKAPAGPNRIEVLQRVAAGDLSVDEAVGTLGGE